MDFVGHKICIITRFLGQLREATDLLLYILFTKNRNYLWDKETHSPVIRDKCPQELVMKFYFLSWLN